MKIYSFENDYCEGCHPRILEKLLKTTHEQQEGYGDDDYSKQAAELIKQKIKNKNAEIHFVSGGTQANLVVASAVLRPHESIISAYTGHINTHEAGAIEATGHKINSIFSSDGKVRVNDIKAVLEEHITVPHMVKPKMVYISNSTEIGTVYKKKELEDISAFCKKNGLHLFLDGARLGSALCAGGNDLTLADISRLTDVFYIGGTKNGAILGEAIVINNEKFKEDFGFHLKQRGALIAKGRLIGIQFLELFKDDLFFSLAKHANSMSMKMAKAIKENGHTFLTKPESNQIFPILPNKVIDKLSEKYKFYTWQKTDKESSAIRLVTSWATNEKVVDQFVKDIRSIK
jgi:threonine aldolase